MNDLVLIKEIVINDPPTFYKNKKIKKSKEAGEDVFDKHYLTANLFYTQNVHYHVISKITHEVKLFLLDKIGVLPELEKMRLEIEIHASKHIDLDNRAYFWKKLFMDILKTPTPRQISNANKRNKPIITTNTIVDDSSQYVDEFSEKFIFGGNVLIFRIFGRVKSTQMEMPLFFK